MWKRAMASWVGCGLASAACASGAFGQQPADTSVKASATAHADSTVPYWQKHIRAANTGPSIGSPPSSFRPELPPEKWCLTDADTTSAHTTADYSHTNAVWSMKQWLAVSRGTLAEFLRDTSEEGSKVRLVFGKPPRLEKSDSLELVSDEALCRETARVINRDLLGWHNGPPPVALFRVRHYLFAHPARTQLGEWGVIVALNEKMIIQGVGTW
jgi:hypothetical protein